MIVSCLVANVSSLVVIVSSLVIIVFPSRALQSIVFRKENLRGETDESPKGALGIPKLSHMGNATSRLSHVGNATSRRYNHQRTCI